MEVFRYIYKTTNLVNGKIHVGVHKTDNLDDGYIGSGKVLKRSISKYGLESFQKDILQFFESDEEMYGMESVLVNEEFIGRKDTYNIKKGGNGGWDFVNKSGLSVPVHKQKNHKEAGKLGMKKLQTLRQDREWFDQCKKKASKALKEYYKTHPGSWTGKNHKEESKRKIGEANAIHQKGSGNSNFGKCWIHNPTERLSKSIPKEDLQQWLDQGWIKGRKMY